MIPQGSSLLSSVHYIHLKIFWRKHGTREIQENPVYASDWLKTGNEFFCDSKCGRTTLLKIQFSKIFLNSTAKKEKNRTNFCF